MANNMNVTLDESTHPWSLKVDQDGHNQVEQNPNPQDINWQLTGSNLANASFLPQGGAEPGFEWKTPVPGAGIFSDPALKSNNQKMTVTDSNPNASTAGTWYYILRATVGATVYRTMAASIAATTTDPCIKNK